MTHQREIFFILFLAAEKKNLEKVEIRTESYPFWENESLLLRGNSQSTLEGMTSCYYGAFLCSKFSLATFTVKVIDFNKLLPIINIFR
jgi:hypothetical protein